MRSFALTLALGILSLGCGSSQGLVPDGGGTAACQQIGTLDRSCTVDSDCVAVVHTTNCCGAGVWLGLRSNESQRFGTLEGACDATYPACGCAAGPPTADDGSTVPFGGAAAVSCQGNICKTYAAACGGPCDTRRSCVSCGGDAGASICSLRCTDDTSCTDAPYTKCQFGFNGGLCTDPSVACTGE